MRAACICLSISCRGYKANTQGFIAPLHNFSLCGVEWMNGNGWIDGFNIIIQMNEVSQFWRIDGKMMCSGIMWNT